MKTVTYHGPSDRRRLADGRLIVRGVPTEIPDHLAAGLSGSNITIQQDETDAATGGEEETD